MYMYVFDIKNMWIIIDLICLGKTMAKFEWVIFVKSQIQKNVSNFSATSLWEQVKFGEMIMISILY